MRIQTHLVVENIEVLGSYIVDPGSITEPSDVSLSDPGFTPAVLKETVVPRLHWYSGFS